MLYRGDSERLIFITIVVLIGIFILVVVLYLWRLKSLERRNREQVIGKYNDVDNSNIIEIN